MPFAIATRLSPSASTSSLYIFTSLSHLSPDHPVGGKLFSVFSPRSSRYKVQPNATAGTSEPTLKAVTSAVVKPLKSSLKHCSSWGRKDTPPSTSTKPVVSSNDLATRIQKSVRFKEIDDQLESVCLFRATGRPSAVLSPNSDSNTESETASSDDDAPSASLSLARGGFAATMVPLEVADIVSPIPSPHTPLTSYTHVRLESLSPTRVTAGLVPGQSQSRPFLLLRGVVRVRNIAYEKCVAARYTNDNWTTATEVLARFAGPDPPASSAAAPATGSGDRKGAWDSFIFTIPIGMRAPPGAPPRTLLLAVRFTVAGVGEWWDNNGGEDFSIVLRPSPAGKRVGTTSGGHGRPPGLEFARQPLAMSCSAVNAHAQAEMAWPAAPAPAAVMNRWTYVACI